MKQHLLFLSLLVMLMGGSLKGWGQTINEFFDYSNDQRLDLQSGWSRHSGTADDLLIKTGNLELINYSSSTNGNYLRVGGSSSSAFSDDANFGIAAINSGFVYVSFLINITNAGSGTYFFHTIDNKGSTPGSNFNLRLFAKKNGTDLNFGADKTSTATYSATSFSFNTTYLIIMRYEFVSGLLNDVVKLWVKSTVPASESELGVEDVTDNLGTDATDIESIAIRQANQSIDGFIDGIRLSSGSTSAEAWKKLGINTNYYSKSIGSLNLPLTWTSKVDGTGTELIDFSTRDKVFNVQNNSTPTLGADWTVSGTNSKIVVGDGTNACVLDAAFNIIAPAFEISANASLSIAAGKQTTISGTLTNSAGASGLVIESDATGTGSLIHNSNSVAATVERYIPGVSYAWHLLGAPVAAQDISGDWIAGNYDFYSWDEAQALWLNQKVGANNLTSFTPGKGYLVAYETAALTKSFSGNLNNGDVVVAITKAGAGGSNGANLLANPYPSGIDWNTATKTLFADNFAYVYDQTANGGAGDFVEIDGSANNAWIAPHQGFFVVAQTAGDFTFTNAMREHGGTYTKNGTTTENELALRLSAETWFDVARIRISEGSTAARDRNDALNFASFTAEAPQLYSMSEDGKQLSINALAEISQETAINLGTVTPVEGAYSLSIESVNGQFGTKTIYLEDQLLGVQHNLTSNGAYSFIGTPADSPTRFLLHFGAVGVSEKPESSALKAYVVGGQLYFPLQGEATLQIVDMQGRVLQQSKVSGQGLTGTAMQQPAGAYVVRLVGSHSVQTAKVIVK